MEELLKDILEKLRSGEQLDAKELAKLLNQHNRALAPDQKHYAKKRLLPYYFKIKNNHPDQWQSWNVSPELEQQLIALLQVKPRRTASGVATITVITKPAPCSSNCIYCPNDLRMPKSYLSDEPACQRAERNCFDPYLQVASRLRALNQMGHVTDKVELIVLGGTWCDYPSAYQIWFITELFCALNDDQAIEAHAQKRRDTYKALGISNKPKDCIAHVAEEQERVNGGTHTYNQAIKTLYTEDPAWTEAATFQHATLDDLKRQHTLNETAAHRVVGLVVETRPDTITPERLSLLRTLGCTKIQMGVQTLDPDILKRNHRSITPERIQRAFELTRLFGFKIHAHFMVNLLGSTPENDKRDYLRFVSEKPWQPDEIKLYPCALIGQTALCDHYDDGTWVPYDEETLVDVLVADTLATPAYARISRMIRDFSAKDIVAGNKKVNLRQLVEERTATRRSTIQEVRQREISTSQINPETLTLDIVRYETTVTTEYFLQWITPENRIAGFLRLSLPNQDYVAHHGTELPIKQGEAMIREVHVYGAAAKLHHTSTGAQHLGLGKKLIAKACAIAHDAGYHAINVISSVGTREYYRKQGFVDSGLYQQRPLP